MKKELMDMATKAGIEFTNDPTETPMTTFVECWKEELEAFAALVAEAAYKRGHAEAIEDFEKIVLPSLLADVAAAERERIKNLDWTQIMRDGGLVTWGDAGTLADRIIDIISAREQE